MSLRPSTTSSPRSCSGLMWMDPTAPASSRVDADATTSSPSAKSSTFTTGTISHFASCKKTLAGFRFLWTTPLSCAAARARATSRPIAAASRWPSFLQRASFCASVSPESSSITRNGSPLPVSPTSRTRATCGCSIAQHACASRRSWTLDSGSGWTTSLRATSSPVAMSSDSQTTPVVPSPSSSRKRYLLAITAPAENGDAPPALELMKIPPLGGYPSSAGHPVKGALSACRVPRRARAIHAAASRREAR